MDNRKISKVGVIGLGRMGRPIARNLIAGGFTVFGFDADRRAVAEAAAAGIEIMPSCAATAAACDAVIIVVGFQAQVEDALFGADGVLAGAGAGTAVLVASTVAPGYMAALDKRVEGQGIQLVDMPVARGEQAAESGDLLVFLGGGDDAVARCRPVIACFAGRIHHLGGPGAGQAAKAVNNMLLWTCLCANVEGLDLGAAMGVDREALRAALLDGSGANWALETRADDRPALWAEKDMTIVLQEAEAAGVSAPVSAAVRQAVEAFKIARGLPRPDDN